jgi:hypothetical protein
MTTQISQRAKEYLETAGTLLRAAQTMLLIGAAFCIALVAMLSRSAHASAAPEHSSEAQGRPPAVSPRNIEAAKAFTAPNPFHRLPGKS